MPKQHLRKTCVTHDEPQGSQVQSFQLRVVYHCHGPVCVCGSVFMAVGEQGRRDGLRLGMYLGGGAQHTQGAGFHIQSSHKYS